MTRTTQLGLLVSAALLEKCVVADAVVVEPVSTLKFFDSPLAQLLQRPYAIPGGRRLGFITRLDLIARSVEGSLFALALVVLDRTVQIFDHLFLGFAGISGETQHIEHTFDNKLQVNEL